MLQTEQSANNRSPLTSWARHGLGLSLGLVLASYSLTSFAYEKFGVFFTPTRSPRSWVKPRGEGILPVRAWRHTGVCNWHQKSRVTCPHLSRSSPLVGERPVAPALLIPMGEPLRRLCWST